MKIGNREFDVENRTYIMGILNVTPDSFSDGGKWTETDRALKHVEEMQKDGADLIDIGGESTRPGHTPVPAQEEMDRVLPMVEAVRSRFDIPISVDTYKACVAEAAVKAGADLINDVWGAKKDPDMAGVMAKTGAVCCLMHNKDEALYENFLEDLAEELKYSVDLVRKAGVEPDKIILDPGVGFGKTYEMNLEAIRHVEEVVFASDKFLGTVAADMEAARKLYDRGYGLVVPMSDSTALGKLAKNTFDRFRELYPEG